MSTTQRAMTGVVVGVVLAAGVTVAAQQGRSDGVSAEAQMLQRRFQFQLMEGVLENAVKQGATEVAMRAQTAMPIGTLFMGQPRAKGFPLDGYGIVFDIEIPVIRESAVIASQMLVPPVPPTGATPVSGRPGAPTTRSTGVVTEDPMTRSPIVPDPFLTEPNQFYRNAVRDKLVDAMLDYSRPLNVPGGEWLSVVARSEDDPMPNSLYDDSRTLILRIKGEDLALFHTGKITREDVKKRVVESQF